MGTVLGRNSLQGYQHTQKVAASKKRVISHLWIYVLKSTTHLFTLNSKIKIKEQLKWCVYFQNLSYFKGPIFHISFCSYDNATVRYNIF